MFHSFRTQVLHIHSLAWYLVTSEDGLNWYATLETFDFGNLAAPEKLLRLDKEKSYKWMCFKVEFEAESELLWKLPWDHSIAKELCTYIDQYIDFIENKF